MTACADRQRPPARRAPQLASQPCSPHSLAPTAPTPNPSTTTTLQFIIMASLALTTRLPLAAPVRRPFNAAAGSSKQPRARPVLRRADGPLREFKEDTGVVSTSTGSSGSGEEASQAQQALYADEKPQASRKQVALRNCILQRRRNGASPVLPPLPAHCTPRPARHAAAAAPRHHEPRDEGAPAPRVLRAGRVPQQADVGQLLPQHHPRHLPAGGWVGEGMGLGQESDARGSVRVCERDVGLVVWWGRSARL